MTPGSAAETVADIKVTVTRSAGEDRAVVVFIDTEFEPGGSDGGPSLRVVINDDPTYEGKAFERSLTSLGVADAVTLDVNLRDIDYEHPHDTGDYSDVQ